MNKIDQIINYVQEMHLINADGCKGSCHETAVGYHYSKYYDTYWYCIFGGYCIGDLSRHNEIQAPTIDELYSKVRYTIEAALKRQEEND